MNAKQLSSLACVGFVVWATAASAAQTAQLRMFNNSIRMNPGKCDCGLGGEFYLHFSSFYTEEVDQANGELVPLSQPPVAATHGSYMILEDVSMSTSVTVLYLNVPTGGFLDVSQEVSASTTGKYPDPWGVRIYDDVNLVWYRPAGATRGTCDITLKDPIMGDQGPFHHTFDVLEYTGTLTYTPSAGSVTGAVILTLTGTPTTLAQGPAIFTRSSTDPHNSLTLEAGSWTGSDGSEMPFSSAVFTRSSDHPMQYSGVVRMTGGYYRAWSLTVVDTNDSNHNAIPDLSDDFVAPAGRPPKLGMACSSGNLHLTISGDVGHDHLIQQADSLSPGAWTTIQTVRLTSDPQVISLPVPAASARFWRVQAQ